MKGLLDVRREVRAGSVCGRWEMKEREGMALWERSKVWREGKIGWEVPGGVIVLILLERRERTCRLGRWARGSREASAVKLLVERERVVMLAVERLDGIVES